jgi:phosphoglycerate kinase
VIGGGMANTFLAAKGDRCRQVAVRARPGRHRPRDPGQGAEEAGCEIVLPVDAVAAREFKAGADNETVPADAARPTR